MLHWDWGLLFEDKIGITRKYRVPLENLGNVFFLLNFRYKPTNSISYPFAPLFDFHRN
jgi:hypothetical protein